MERRSQGIFHTPCLIVKKKTKEVLRHREPKNRASTEAIILHHTYSIPHILNITGSNLIELYCIEWFCCVINSLFLYHPRFELFHHCLIFCVICVLFCISPVFFFCVAPFSFLYIIRIWFCIIQTSLCLQGSFIKAEHTTEARVCQHVMMISSRLPTYVFFVFVCWKPKLKSKMQISWVGRSTRSLLEHRGGWLCLCS